MPTSSIPVEPAPRPVRVRHRRRLTVGAAAVAAAAVLAAAVLVPAHLERQRVERLTAAATADAAALADALSEAREAGATHAAAAAALGEVLDLVARPFAEVTLGMLDEGGRARLAEQLDGLDALLADVHVAEPALAAGFADVPLADALADRYVGTRDDESLSRAQRDRDAELERLATLTGDAQAGAAALHEGARGFVAAVAELAPAVAHAARATPEQHDRASDEVRAQLDAVAGAVEGLVDVAPDPGATVDDVRAAVLALEPSAVDRVHALGAAVEAVRVSHAEVVAAEEAAAREAAEAARRQAARSQRGGGGGGGDSEGGCQFIPMGLTMTFVCH